jgi:tetratricopeptide (TPR) repeat protein
VFNTRPEFLLDAIGLKFGTDKSSYGHGYLDNYEDLFSAIRNASFNLLEIGVFEGNSVKTWQEFFPNANIIGIDIDEDCQRFTRDRIHIAIGSQDDPGFLAELVRSWPPGIVIDDGSHRAHDVIYTFETLFPALTDGGYYLIEDLHFHHGEMADHSQGFSDTNPIDYFQELASLSVHRTLDAKKNWGFRAYCRQHVHSVMFLNKSCIVRKSRRIAAADLDAWTERVEAVSPGSQDSGHWARVAGAIIRRELPPARAEAAARKAIELAPGAGGLQTLLSRILTRKHDLDGAISAARKAAELDQQRGGDDAADSFENLGELLEQAGHAPQALSAYQEAYRKSAHPVVAARIGSENSEARSKAQ